MSENTDVYDEIIKDSDKKINKLKILINFFNQEYLQNICIRIQIIHQLFLNNKELDIFKLNLFHTQYTDTIISLLANIKKIKEQNILLLDKEIQINNERLEKFNIKSTDNYNADKVIYTKTISKILKSCFQILSKNYNDVDPFIKTNFNDKYNKDYFQDIPLTDINDFEKYNENDVYTNPFFIIHKKLLGIINKFDYNIEFIKGIKNTNLYVNIFKIDKNYFIFVPYKKMFLLYDDEIIKKYITLTPDNKTTSKQSIQNRIDELQTQIIKTKSTLPTDTENVLMDFLQKINNINFLEDLQKVDVQTNILRSMLKTEAL